MGVSLGSLKNYDNNYSSTPSANQDGLVLNGTTVSNIYPFDAQGKQVSVRLYDQEGNPIALQLEDCETTYGRADRSTTSNLFPHRIVTPDESGNVEEQNCKDSDRAPFIPPPAPATTTTPSATPSTRPTTPTASATTPGVTMTVQPTR
jgi:hypothetical protein